MFLVDLITSFACTLRSSRTPTAAPHPGRGQLEALVLSVQSGADAVQALRAACARCSDDTDLLLEFLIRTYRLAPLSEVQMRTISRLQQQYETHGNATEYATMTLWICAIQSAMDRQTVDAWARRELVRAKASNWKSGSCPAKLWSSA